MIDAKSLRIGNWILDNSVMGEIKLKVELGTFYWVEKYPDSYNPIPLTPEILHKVGFDGKDFIQFNDDGFLNTEKDHIILQLEKYDDLVRIHMNHVKHLHQLQNLYYALTNQELNITL